jgi:sortase (surface protein transpeptidase)
MLPLRLLIPRVDIEGPIVAVGLTPQDAMDVPQRPGDVGWYQYGPRPGSQGNAVLAGHIDWQGEVGVFARLRQVLPSDLVIIRGADSESRRYLAQWLEEYPVAAAPVAKVFETLDYPALTLITCGGRWNPATRLYDTRVVVRAARAA